MIEAQIAARKNLRGSCINRRPLSGRTVNGVPEQWHVARKNLRARRIGGRPIKVNGWRRVGAVVLALMMIVGAAEGGDRGEAPLAKGWAPDRVDVGVRGVAPLVKGWAPDRVDVGGRGVAPVVTGFAPDTAEACAHYMMGSISGDNILEGLTVRLTKEGEADVVGEVWSNFPADPVFVRFWFTASTALGPWNVEVVNLDGQSNTLPDAVAIVADADCPFGAVGDLYVTERQYRYGKVMEFDGATGDTVGDFLPPGYEGLNHPSGLAFMPNGNLLVTTADPSGALEFDADTGAFIREFVPVIHPGPHDVSSLNGWLSWPTDAVFGPDGNLYMSSRWDDKVNKYDGETGEWIDFFAIGGPGPGLDYPWALRFGPNGNLFVAYGQRDAWEQPQFYGVAEFHGATGNFIRAFGAGGGMDTGIASIFTGLAFSPAGDLLVIEQKWPTSYPRVLLWSKVRAFDLTTGASLGTFIPSGVEGIPLMNRVVYGPNGNLFVDGQDEESWGTVFEFDPISGEPMGTFSYPGSVGQGGLGEPKGLVFRPEPPDPLPAPTISGVSVAQQVDACDPLTGVVVTGAGLAPNETRVMLSREGGDSPYPDYVGMVTGGTDGGSWLTVDFDLDGGIIDSGPWDVVVTNPDGQSDTLVAALDLTGCRSAREGNLLAAVHRARNQHAVTGIMEFDGQSGDIVGWFAADRFAPSIAGELSFVNGMEFGPNGNLFVAADWPGPEPDARYIIEFDGVTDRRLGEFVPADSGGLRWPYDLTFAPDGNLFVLHHQDYPPWLSPAGVLEFDGLTGAFVRTFVAMGDCRLAKASKLVFGPNGNLYVTTYYNGVLEFDGETGECLGPAVLVFSAWPGLIFSPHTDKLLVHRGYTHPTLGVLSEILEFDVGPDRGEGTTFVEPGSCGLGSPGNANGMAFGPDGHLYVSSWSNSTHELNVLRFDGWTGEDCGEFAFHDANRSAGSPPYELAFRPIPGDMDGDWKVDLRDAARFQGCFGSGAGGETPNDYWCLRFDADRDGDVDANDVRGFTRGLAGPE